MAAKNISVPMSLQGIDDLNYMKVNPDAIEINIPDTMFYELWKSGFFDSINLICNAAIDDFESEEITDCFALERLIKEKETIIKKIDSTELKNIATSLFLIFEIGLKRETGIFFSF